MKINTLGRWKHFTTWGGFAITACGAFYALSHGKLDSVSGSLTFGGISINGVGNLIGMAQSKREKDARKQAENELENRLTQVETKATIAFLG